MSAQQPLFGGCRYAGFSHCRKYRYWLNLEWGPGPFINFVMLNPSTADEVKNDPTVERCERRARSAGYGGVIITNLFAWRATDPRELKAVENPYGGAEADDAIHNGALDAETVVCAWGNGGLFEKRWRSALYLIRKAGATPRYLRLTKAGQPQHPLYVPYSELPKPWMVE